MTEPREDPTVVPASEAIAHGDREIRRSYIRVIVVWAVTLAALYAFQEYFS